MDLIDTIEQKDFKHAHRKCQNILRWHGKRSGSIIPFCDWKGEKLEHSGIIKSYSANVNYKMLGYDILAFIGISLDSAQSISDFEVTITNFDEDIIECHHVTGDFNK